ncbi:MAG: AAA family ATPase [Candidatus Kuenenia sp.]|nr:AAA family ATPase [Candidatus Kuenenia hertensis]
MYYNYWNLEKPPFDNVPDPSMYAECHTSMENAIAETLFAIEEGGECIAVIVGDVGLGKTMSLRMIIDSIAQDKYKIALITNPSTTFVQLMREIIGQITGKQCEEKKKVDLIEIFNKLLFKTIDEGKKVLVFIDEANAISSANLENLRLLTNMQDDKRNLFTMVLAGQMELARRLEQPKFANLFQRIGTYNKIEKIPSIDMVKSYVETRIKLAGGKRKIFTDDAFNIIWEHSEHGIPRLINKICKLALKAGETNGFCEINGEVIHQVGERFRKITGPAVQKRMPRKRPKEEMIPSSVEELEIVHEKVSVNQKEEHDEQLVEKWSMKEPSIDLPEENSTEEDSLSLNKNEYFEPFITQSSSCAMPASVINNDSLVQDDIAETEIGECKLRIILPSDLIQQAQSTTQEHRLKLAGAMAAKTLKENPQLTKSPYADPVSIWSEIRDLVLSKIG